MQCTLTFNSIEDVKSVLGDLTDPQSEHLLALKGVLVKELRDVTLREMSNFNPPDVELVPCLAEDHEHFDRNEYTRCGEF